MKDYWYPVTPSVFKADTMQLTPHQEGCYWRLIFHYMDTKKPIPDNDIALARICGLLEADLKQDKAVLMAFFVLDDGKWRHVYCEKILKEQAEFAEKKRERAVLGGKAKAAKQKQRIDNKQTHALSRPQAELSNASALLKRATEQNRTEQNLLPPNPQRGSRAKAQRGGGNKIDSEIQSAYIAISARFLKHPESVSDEDKMLMWSYEEIQAENMKAKKAQVGA